MKVLTTFYYELWHNMPFWMAIISIWLLFPIISRNNDPEIALFNSAGIASVLFFSNIFMTVLKKLNPFKDKGFTKAKYIAVVARIILFIVLSAAVVTTIELICQAFFYNQYLKLVTYYPFYFLPCLVLSQYGSFPIQHTLKDTIINSIYCGIGFGIFLIIIGAVSFIISRYLYIPHLPTIIGIAGLILILGLSKVRANHRINAETQSGAF